MSLTEKRKAKAEEKALEKEEAKAAFRLNQIKPATNAGFNALFVLLSFVCMFPLFYVFMISISSTDSITKYGYRLFPETYSNAAYTLLWNERGTIGRALLISVVVTVVGTVLGVLLTTMIGYVLSRPNYTVLPSGIRIGAFKIRLITNRSCLSWIPSVQSCRISLLWFTLSKNPLMSNSKT